MAGSRPVVFVLAMSRTGSSAITRILSLTGMNLPTDLLAANDGNPTGYWEPADVVALNDRFLTKRRSSYYDPTLCVQADDAAFASEDAHEFTAEIASFIGAHDADTPLLIKDPRLVALAPYWYRGAALAGRTVHCVLPVRDPRAVVASLVARDGTSDAYANVLWLKYTLLAERLSRRFPRVFVGYPSAIADWRPQVARVARELSIPLHKRRKVTIDAFVDPRLDHRTREGVPTDPLVPLSDVVFAQVERAASDAPIERSVMDEAFARFSQASCVSFPVLRDRENIAAWDGVGKRVARELMKVAGM